MTEWKLEGRKGDRIVAGREGSCLRDKTQWVLSGRAGGTDVSNAHRVVVKSNYGGASNFPEKEWPVVEAHVALPAGKEELAEALAAEFRDVIDRFLFAHEEDLR